MLEDTTNKVYYHPSEDVVLLSVVDHQGSISTFIVDSKNKTVRLQWENTLPHRALHFHTLQCKRDPSGDNHEMENKKEYATCLTVRHRHNNNNYNNTIMCVQADWYEKEEETNAARKLNDGTLNNNNNNNSHICLKTETEFVAEINIWNGHFNYILPEVENCQHKNNNNNNDSKTVNVWWHMTEKSQTAYRKNKNHHFTNLGSFLVESEVHVSMANDNLARITTTEEDDTDWVQVHLNHHHNGENTISFQFADGEKTDITHSNIILFAFAVVYRERTQTSVLVPLSAQCNQSNNNNDPLPHNNNNNEFVSEVAAQQAKEHPNHLLQWQCIKPFQDNYVLLFSQPHRHLPHPSVGSEGTPFFPSRESSLYAYHFTKPNHNKPAFAPYEPPPSTTPSSSTSPPPEKTNNNTSQNNRIMIPSSSMDSFMSTPTTLQSSPTRRTSAEHLFTFDNRIPKKSNKSNIYLSPRGQQLYIGKRENRNNSNNNRNQNSILCYTSESSFFDENFIPLRVLGKGGGGVVLLVKHKITFFFYAIKLLLIDNYEVEKDVLKEVRLHAMLTNQRNNNNNNNTHNNNLVRYYSCWSEVVSPQRAIQLAMVNACSRRAVFSALQKINNNNNNNSMTNHKSEEKFFLQQVRKQMRMRWGSIFYNMNSDANNTDNNRPRIDGIPHNVSFPLEEEEEDSDSLEDFSEEYAVASEASTMTSADSSEEPSTWSEGSSTVAVDTSKETDTDSIPNIIGARVIFLQLELCQTTLDLVLQERNNHNNNKSVDRIENLIFLIQMLNGLRYLHGRGILHRDLKPSNIFINFYSQSDVLLYNSNNRNANHIEEKEEEDEYYREVYKDIQSMHGGTNNNNNKECDDCDDEVCMSLACVNPNKSAFRNDTDNYKKYYFSNFYEGGSINNSYYFFSSSDSSSPTYPSSKTSPYSPLDVNYNSNNNNNNSFEEEFIDSLLTTKHHDSATMVRFIGRNYVANHKDNNNNNNSNHDKEDCLTYTMEELLSHHAQVRLGDFGISKDIVSSHYTATSAPSQGVASGPPPFSPHTVGVGSPLYAAPEQLRGDTTIHVYSDAFSFGIIFLELYASFYTTGERLDQLSKWRRGHFDYFYEKTSTDSKSLMEQFPEISLAMGLMAADPLQRLPLHIVRQKLMEQLRECVQEKLTLEKK